MNRTILSQLKRSIKHNLEDKAGQIIGSYGSFLSRKDIDLLMRYMIRHGMYSMQIIRYVYCISPHRHELSAYIRTSRYMILSYAGTNKCGIEPSRAIEIINILLYSLFVEQYSWNTYTHNAIEYVIRNCNSKILIHMLGYVHDKCEPHYMHSKIELAIENACDMEHIDVILFILEDERISRYIGIGSNLYALALKMSSARNRYRIVRILLKHLDRFVPESTQSMCMGTALLNACSKGSLETVRCFLEDPRIDLAYERNAAISVACEFDNPAIVRLLLDDERVDPTQKPISTQMLRYLYKEPIHAAQTYEIIKMLMDDGRVDPSSDNNQALIDAITGHIEGADRDIIRLLLSDRRVLLAGLTPAITTAKFYRCGSDVMDMLQAAQMESENIGKH